MQGVILAGGLGTRLESRAGQIPKPMLVIGDKPLLEHQILLLKSYDVTDIIILVGHLKEKIISYFHDGAAWGVSIRYYEEAQPLGTVGGIKAIEDWIHDDFFVLYGDVMFSMDLHRLQAFHKERSSECTLVLHPNDHPYDSDLVDIDEHDRITAFHSKPRTDNRYYRNMVNAGLYLFTPAIFQYLEKGRKADFGREVFPRICNQIRMYGYNTSEYLKDMGTPDRLDKVTADYVNGKIDRKSYRNAQKAIFLDRDGVINPDKDLISRVEDLELFPFTAEAIKTINDSDYLAIVATNQSVVARNLCTEDELRIIHNKLDTLLGNEHAKLDALYYCPHHPDKGYAGENPAYKIECDCRKPKPGMLLNAAARFNIDLSSSFFIGDDQRDIEAGKRAGVTTVGVMTGKGLRTTRILPDYFFQDLQEAVDFIIHDPYYDLFRQVEDHYSKSAAQPYIILIGGNSRAGKSLLATYLEKSFLREKKSVLRINLDNWIIAKEQRKDSFTVLDNFQLDRLTADVQRILRGETVEVPGYAQHPNRPVNSIAYQYKNERIILIEGVVALADAALTNMAHLRIFKQVSMHELEKRFRNFYQWKGMSDEAINTLFEHRKEKEFNIIENHRQTADLIF